MEATIQVPDTVVPYVRFDPRNLAAQRIRAAGLIPAFTGADSAQAWVLIQSPPSGARVAGGSTVTLHLREGPIP